MCDRHRSALRTFAVLLLLGLPDVGRAQPAILSEVVKPSTASASGQYVLVGKLELRPQGYVLTRGNGELETYLIPRKSLDLTGFVGKTVEATVREPVAHGQ